MAPTAAAKATAAKSKAAPPVPASAEAVAPSAEVEAVEAEPKNKKRKVHSDAVRTMNNCQTYFVVSTMARPRPPLMMRGRQQDKP